MKCLAIRVRQPIGEFFLTSLPASLLLKVCFRKPHSRYCMNQDGSVCDSGIQRKRVESRVTSIHDFLQTTEATLPGTLVLAANFTEDGKFIGDDENGFLDSRRWEKRAIDEEHRLFEITFPEDQRLVAIVDGQHRLGGFEGQTDNTVAQMELPCAIFLDMPIPLQAYVFATINFNQKPVSKSQTYELFGYNIDHEEPCAWSPDKFAVFLTRKLNADEKSPINGHIKVSAIDYTESNVEHSLAGHWLVSTATFVNGILSMISSNPQNDRNVMNQVVLADRNRSMLVSSDSDKGMPPLRGYYVECCDELIYKIFCNFFIATEALFNSEKHEQYELFHKTVGVNALFKVMKILLPIAIDNGDVTAMMWMQWFLSKNKMIDFHDPYLSGSSGTHVGRIRDMLLLMAGYKKLEDFKEKECYPYYEQLWNNAKDVSNA